MFSVAQQFADLLDDARFEEAAQLLAEDCHYHYSEGNYAGRKNVINIHKHNHKHSSEMFDEVRYGSVVEPMDGRRWRIDLYDKVRIGEKWHEIKSYDVLQFDGDLISDIHHHEIPGQNEAFMAFWRNARAAA